MTLQQDIERLSDSGDARDFETFAAFKQALNRGEIRAAEPDASMPTGWRVNTWVKKGILYGFRLGVIVDWSVTYFYI